MAAAPVYATRKFSGTTVAWSRPRENWSRTGVAKPVIRGLTASRVLVVADGVRQEGQGWGDEHGPEIGAADVDRIEVVRGPLSLLYGSDALGGVVQTDSDNLFTSATPLARTGRPSTLSDASLLPHPAGA